jgi:hypothetical protein
MLEFGVPDNIMKSYRIRIKATSEIAEATWTSDGKYFLPNGSTLSRDEADLLSPFSVEAQVWEWYGNDDVEPNDSGIGGRYKAKGGETIIVYLTEDEAMYGDFEAKLSAQLMKEGRYIKYELRSSLMPYYPPTVLDYSVKADAFTRLK